MKFDSKMGHWAPKSAASSATVSGKLQRRDSPTSHSLGTASENGERDSLEDKRKPAAADSRSSERLEKKSEGSKTGVRLRSQSFIEDSRIRETTKPNVFPTDKTGHPLAAKLEAAREWTPANERKAVGLIQRHFNRKKDPMWPDLSAGTEASKMMRAKGIINRIMARVTKVEFKADRRGVMVARYRMHGQEQKEVGPGIPNSGSGVMYSENGMIHLIDKDRSPEILARDHAAMAAEIEAKQAKAQSRLIDDIKGLDVNKEMVREN